MKCNDCGYENTDSARFCSGCGRELGIDITDGEEAAVDTSANITRNNANNTTKDIKAVFLTCALFIFLPAILLGIGMAIADAINNKGSESKCVLANATQHYAINSSMMAGYSIGDAYIAKTNEYDGKWSFVAAPVRGSGALGDIGLWAIHTADDPTLACAVNSVAIDYSILPSCSGGALKNLTLLSDGANDVRNCAKLEITNKSNSNTSQNNAPSVFTKTASPTKMLVFTKTITPSKTFRPTKTSNYCNAVDIDKAVDELKDITDRHVDALNVANSTARIALAGPIETLQEIRRDIQKVAVPPCMEPFKQKYIESMDFYIDAFLKFMSDANEQEVADYINQADTAAEEATNMITQITACMPNCENLVFTSPTANSNAQELITPTKTILYTKTIIPNMTATPAKIITRSQSASSFDINRCISPSEKQVLNIELGLIDEYSKSTLEKVVTLQSNEFNNLWFVAARIKLPGITQRRYGVWAMLPSKEEPEFACSITLDAFTYSEYPFCDKVSKLNENIPEGISMSLTEVILAELCVTIE